MAKLALPKVNDVVAGAVITMAGLAAWELFGRDFALNLKQRVFG